MSKKKVVDLPGLSNRGWRYTQTVAPQVQEVFSIDMQRGLYIWMDWSLAADGEMITPRVNASQLPPYAEPEDSDEVISVSLEQMIRAAGAWLFALRSNHTGTLTFENRGELDALNNDLEGFAALLERLAQEARGLKVSEADLTEAWDAQGWNHE